MGAHAIVIGIDHYARPEWQLTGAVRDALRFVAWVTTAGGVADDDLHLLLAPAPTTKPSDLKEAAAPKQDLVYRAVLPTKDAIQRLLHSYYRGKAGDEADRLWVYYAGHGLAPPAASPEAGPLIVPCDVDDLTYYLDEGPPIGLELHRQRMQNAPPRQQFYIVDACRDVIDVADGQVVTQALIWDPPKDDAAFSSSLATQVVFLASTAGERAREVRGQGVFAKVLLAGLRGGGPELSRPAVVGGTHRRLEYSKLVAFVQSAMAREMDALQQPGESAPPAQTPHAAILRAGDITIAEYDDDALPRFTITAQIEPEAVLGSAQLAALQWDDASGRFVQRQTNPAPIGPPVTRRSQFQLRGGRHPISVSATGYKEWTDEVEVYDDKTILIELVRAAPPSRGQDGLESIAAAAGLDVHTRDPLAVITVTDGGGAVVATGVGSLSADLPVGHYVCAAWVDASTRTQTSFTVQDGERAGAELPLVTRPIDPNMVSELQAVGIEVDDGFIHSATLDTIAPKGLSSIMLLAAWAARWPNEDGVAHLRALGINALAADDGAAETSGVQVVIGRNVDDAAEFFERCRISLHRADADAGVGPDSGTQLELQTATGLQRVRQTGVAATPATYALELDLPGFTPLRIVVEVLPDLDTVVVVCIEHHRTLEILQVHAPRDPSRPMADGVRAPEPMDVRRVELATRALRDDLPLTRGEFDAIRAHLTANPLLGVLTGYRALRHRVPVKAQTAGGDDGRLDARVSDADLSDLVRALVNAYPEVPDMHMLDAMLSGDDDRFLAAMESGTPVVLDGFQAGVAWLTKAAAVQELPLPQLQFGAVTGLTWTAFTTAPQEETDKTRVPVVSRSGFVDRLRDVSDVTLRAAAAVGRVGVRRPAHNFAYSGAAFLIAPRVVVCPKFVVDHALMTDDAGHAQLRGGVEVRVEFDLGDESATRAVAEVLGVAMVEGQNHGWNGPLVLFGLTEPAIVAPLALALELPNAGDPVDVVGFPRPDARIPETLSRRFAALQRTKRKQIMSGEVIHLAQTPFAAQAGTTLVFGHDALTSAGTAGGPVLSGEQDGTVLGIHVAGEWTPEGKRNSAIAAAGFRDHPLFLEHGATFR